MPGTVLLVALMFLFPANPVAKHPISKSMIQRAEILQDVGSSRVITRKDECKAA